MLLRLNNLAAFVREHLLPLCKEHHIFTFIGPLGAGKTTLIRELLKQQGIQEAITSPTFGYIKSYKTPSGTALYHFDLYRITSIEDFIAAGFDEYIQQPKSISYIEWPEVIDQLLKNKNLASTIVEVTMSYHPTDHTMREMQIHTKQQ